MLCVCTRMCIPSVYNKPYLCNFDYVAISRFHHADTDSIRLSLLLWQEVWAFPSCGILTPLHYVAISTGNRLHQPLQWIRHQYDRNNGNRYKVVIDS